MIKLLTSLFIILARDAKVDYLHDMVGDDEATKVMESREKVKKLIRRTCSPIREQGNKVKEAMLKKGKSIKDDILGKGEKIKRRLWENGLSKAKTWSWTD